MSNRKPGKKISAAAIQALKEALTYAYWYKSDLRSFLNHAISDASIVSRLNWSEYKRNIVGSLVDFLARNEDVYQRQLLRLMTETSNIDDFSHLARLDDGKSKVRQAKSAIGALRSQLKGHLELVEAQKDIEKRRAESHERLMQVTAVKDGPEELTRDYFTLLGGEMVFYATRVELCGVKICGDTRMVAFGRSLTNSASVPHETTLLRTAATSWLPG